MSLLDSVTIFDWDGPSFGVGRRGRRLLRRGDEATARIVGIKVSRTSNGESDGSNSNHYFYALEVPSPHGPPARLGCRQNLHPRRELAGLGSEVVVRRRGWRVIIDWTATLERLGARPGGPTDCPDFWKPTRRPVADGVQDHEQNGARRRIGQSRPARATVLRITTEGGIFGSVSNVDVDVLVTLKDGTTSQGLLRRIVPPDYAASLLTVGRVLPVGVDRDGARITVDWLAAAGGDTAVDPAPPAPTREPEAEQPSGAGGKLGAFMTGMVASALDKGGMPTDAPGGEEISFDTFVAVSAGLARDAVPPAGHDAYAQRHGVPAGHWGPASRAWQARMATDWKLGARYGDAYGRAFQGGGGSGSDGGEPAGGGSAGFGAG